MQTCHYSWHWLSKCLWYVPSIISPGLLWPGAYPPPNHGGRTSHISPYSYISIYRSAWNVLPIINFLILQLASHNKWCSSSRQHASSKHHRIIIQNKHILTCITSYGIYKHYTVKYEFCARKKTQSFHEHCSLRKLWKYCSYHLVLTFCTCYTQTVLKWICLTQSCRQSVIKTTLVPINKTLSLPAPLKDNTNRQLALVKWNNVFSIQFIQK